MKIDINATSNNGYTAFHTACFRGQTSIVYLIIDKRKYFYLDFLVKKVKGQTGYQIARAYGRTDVTNLIKTKCPSLCNGQIR